MTQIHAGLRAGAGYGARPAGLDSIEKARRQDVKDESADSLFEESSHGAESAVSMSRMSTLESNYVPCEVEHSTAWSSCSARLEMIVQDVAAHYKVSTCVATVYDDDGGLRLESQWSSRGEVVLDEQKSDSKGFRFFYHHTSRDLPIIIDDTVLYKNVCEHALVTGPPHVRFYAGAPLIDGPGNYVGTLCIMDHLAKPGFSLMDADYLVKMASEVIGILKEAGRVGL